MTTREPETRTAIVVKVSKTDAEVILGEENEQKVKTEKINIQSKTRFRDIGDILNVCDRIQVTVQGQDPMVITYDADVPNARILGDIDWSALDTSFHEDSDKTIIKESLVTEFAQKVAEASAKNGLAANALRNFYDAVKDIETRLGRMETLSEKENAFRVHLPLIKMLTAKVAHAKGRKKIPEVFEKFLRECIKNVTSLADFEAFLLIFEAVAGWHTMFSKEGRES